MHHPEIGARVVVRPRPGLRVQRGHDLFGQFLPDDGQEVVWDEYLQRRHAEGALILPPEYYAEASASALVCSGCGTNLGGNHFNAHGPVDPRGDATWITRAEREKRLAKKENG